jgi:TrmH family RNA methyltransferase
MTRRVEKKETAFSNSFTLVLSRPENPENIGLVARNMKNTGFASLRIVGMDSLDSRSYSVAVHAREILEKAQFFDTVAQATADLNVVFASTSKRRKNFVLLTMEKAISRMLAFHPQVKIGLLFGCERTGLTSEELKNANFVFTIPQACRQPSYNLSSAVLITLFSLYFKQNPEKKSESEEIPLLRGEQEECIQRILEKLEAKGFIHKTNRVHMTERIHGLLGRLNITAKDRELLLALFSKGVEERKPSHFPES